MSVDNIEPNKMPALTKSDVFIDKDVMTIRGKPIPFPKVGQYLSVWEKEGSSKRHIVQVTQVGKSKITVDHHHLSHVTGYSVEDVEYPFFHIVSNLGEVNSETNRLYSEPGIEPLIKTVNTSMGKVHFFRVMSKRERKDLLAAIEKVYVQCCALRWNIFPIDIEVRNPKGKWAGYYATHKIPKDKEARVDTMCLQPKEWDRKQLNYLLWHELWHGVQNNLLLMPEHALWVKEYHKSVTLSTIKPDELQEVLADFLHAGDEYSPPNDRQADIFGVAIDYMEENHKLRWKDIEKLLCASKLDLIKTSWPTGGQISDQKPEVSEYSLKNADEYGAEVMAFKLSGIPLSDRISTFADKQIKAIQGRCSPMKVPEKKPKKKKSKK